MFPLEADLPNVIQNHQKQMIHRGQNVIRPIHEKFALRQVHR